MRVELRRGLRLSELRAAYIRAKAHVPSVEVPSWLGLLWEKASLWRVIRLRQTRRDLARFWVGVAWRLRHGRVEALLRVDQLALNALREIRLAAGFLNALLTAGS